MLLESVASVGFRVLKMILCWDRSENHCTASAFGLDFSASAFCFSKLLARLVAEIGRPLIGSFLHETPKHPRRQSTQRKAQALDRAGELSQSILDRRRNPYEGYRETLCDLHQGEPEQLEAALSTPKHRA